RRLGDLQGGVEAAERAQLGPTLSDLAPERIEERPRDLTRARVEGLDVALPPEVHDAHPAFDAHRLAGPVDVAIVEDVPDPAAALRVLRPSAVLREIRRAVGEERHVRAAARDEHRPFAAPRRGERERRETSAIGLHLAVPRLEVE